jgi:Eukaryotic aspartyl protease
MHTPVSTRSGQIDGAIRKGSTSGFHVVQLFGGMVAVGEYYAKVHIGGQMLRAQIDTGSATLAVPLEECESCLRGDRRYNIHASPQKKGRRIGCGDTICTPNKCSPYSCGACSPKSNACCANSDKSMCGFHLKFGDGSGAQGMLIEDDMSWGGISFPVVFGGIDKDSPDFERKQVDGILGMAYSSLACNPSCAKPPFEAMVDHLAMRDIFQICISSDSGRIILGDYDKSLMKEQLHWVPMHLSSPPSYYTVQVSGNLEINDQEVVFDRYKRAIVDSGTTLIVFTHAAFNVIVDHLKENYCDVPGLCDADSWFRPAHCTKISEEDRRKLPTLRFHLVGFDIVLTPDEYLINYKSKGPDSWCVGIMALDSLSGGIDVIFGNTAMKKYVTVYDRENKRIGFGESTGHCTSTGKTSDSSTAAATVAPTPGGSGDTSGTTGTSVATIPATTVTVASTSNRGHAQQKADPGAVFADAAKCEAAKDCGACAAVEGVGDTCVWSTSEAQCLVGHKKRFMCLLDAVENQLLFVVVGISSLLVLIIIGCACYCVRRKQRDAMHEAAIDSDEAMESRVPLAPVRQDARMVARNHYELEDTAEEF